MAKKSIKIKDLNSGLPSSGQAPDGTGIPAYNYAPLKQSLEDDGYAPEKHSYIHIKEDGTVLNGNRRTHLMQKELSMDQDVEVECEVKTHLEWIQDLKDIIGLEDSMVGSKDKDGNVTGAKIMTTQAIKGGSTKGYPSLVKIHKRHADIEGYPYDFVDSEGDSIDAGKSS